MDAENDPISSRAAFLALQGNGLCASRTAYVCLRENKAHGYGTLRFLSHRAPPDYFACTAHLYTEDAEKVLATVSFSFFKRK